MFRPYITKGYWCIPLFIAGCAFWGCKRMPGQRPTTASSGAVPMHREALCVEREEGCIHCTAREGPPQVSLDLDQARPLLCNPKDEQDCLEFCTQLAPECAAPWFGGHSCLLDSELAFQRAVFNRDTSDKPEMQFMGRVADESGKRIESATVDVWVTRTGQPTAMLAKETTGKDGAFRLHLRLGTWTYTLRITRPGLATEIVEGLQPEKKSGPGTAPPARIFRMGTEFSIKGRIVEDLPTGQAVAGVVVSAMRGPEDWIEVSTTTTGEDGSFVLGGLENKRYHLRASKFGWKPTVTKGVQSGAINRTHVRMKRATVIRGNVEDSAGEPEPYATVAALLSESPGLPTTPIFWSSDRKGKFEQDRFAPGVYYLWARKGEMLAYPPEKIELTEGGEIELTLSLKHKGSKVNGLVQGAEGYDRKPNLRALLSSRSSPLVFPRPAVASVDKETGAFSFQGLLPGRYEISVLDVAKAMAIVRGPKDLEIPIDADAPIQMREPIVVRPLVAE